MAEEKTRELKELEKLEELVARCRHPLQVRLIIDPNKGWFVSVTYEGCPPAILKSKEMPESIEDFLVNAIKEFNLDKNNKGASQHKLLDKDKDVKPVKASTKPKSKTKSTRKIANPLF